MSGHLFAREFEIALNFTGDHIVVDYDTCHKLAKADHVVLRCEFDHLKRLFAEYGVIIVRDFGLETKPAWRRSVVVVRKSNDITPLPEEAGDLLGVLSPKADHFAYYVFAAKGGPRSIGSSSAETTSLAPGVAKSTRACEHPPEGCPCVVAGTKVHDADRAETGGAAARPAWWESQDEPQSNVG
jgi:hypothetical protein